MLVPSDTYSDDSAVYSHRDDRAKPVHHHKVDSAKHSPSCPSGGPGFKCDARDMGGAGQDRDAPPTDV